MRIVKERYCRMDNTKPMIYQNEDTGIYSKDFFFAAGKILLQLAKRNQVPLLVAIVNINNLEDLNSEYGNNVGDKMLELITKITHDKFRDSDLIAYLGDAQIGIIFYNITSEVAKTTLEGLRDKLSNNIYNVTVSIGGTIMNSRTNSGSIDTAYKQACMAIETAQQKGKNSVVVY